MSKLKKPEIHVVTTSDSVIIQFDQTAISNYVRRLLEEHVPNTTSRNGNFYIPLPEEITNPDKVRGKGKTIYVVSWKMRGENIGAGREMSTHSLTVAANDESEVVNYVRTQEPNARNISIRKK